MSSAENIFSQVSGNEEHKRVKSDPKVLLLSSLWNWCWGVRRQGREDGEGEGGKGGVKIRWQWVYEKGTNNDPFLGVYLTWPLILYKVQKFIHLAWAWKDDLTSIGVPTLSSLVYIKYKSTVLTIIVPVAIIHFSSNFGQNLLSKMRLLIELRLLL